MLARTAWSVALGLVTLDCVKGLGGPADLLYILGVTPNLRLVDRFLSWGVFQPLAKISYMMYLVHITVINNLFLYTRTYSMEHNNFSQTTQFIGIVAVSFAISLVFTLTFEAPFMHLQKLLVGELMRGGKKSKKTDKVTEVKTDVKANGQNGHFEEATTPRIYALQKESNG